MGTGISLEGFADGAFPSGVWDGPLGFGVSGMNLNHWANAAWAESSMIGWGDSGESTSTYGGSSKRRRKKLPRRYSDPEPFVPVRPEVFVAEQPRIVVPNLAKELYLALEKRERRNRMKKVAAIAVSFMDSL